MAICPNCEHDNPDILSHCLKCDTPLDQRTVSPHTIHVSSAMREMIDAILQETVLVLTPESVTFRVGERFVTTPIGNKVFLGSDSAMTLPSFVDLSPYIDIHFGVSRLHAAIVRYDDHHFQVMDLDSTNGTAIDDVVLQPFHLYHLEDEATLNIGKCELRVIYDEK